jgi:hypothetical protein
MSNQKWGVSYRIKRLKTENLKTTESVKSKISYIQNVALPLHWKISAFYNKSSKLSLERDDVKMVIDLIRNNVVTTMSHYKYVRPTKLKREALELTDIGAILFDPRAHTNKGHFITHVRKRKP